MQPQGDDTASIAATSEQIAQISKDVEGLRTQAKGYLDNADHLEKADKNDKSDKPAEIHVGFYAAAADQNKIVKTEFAKFVATPELKESAARDRHGNGWSTSTTTPTRRCAASPRATAAGEAVRR